MYNPRILTPQEHQLFGSTVDRKFFSNPYKPLIVFDEEMSVEECSELRKNLGEIKVICSYFGIRGVLGVAKIFPLDTNPNSPNYGSSLEDPILIKSDNLEYFNNNFFPFSRQGPRVNLQL